MKTQLLILVGILLLFTGNSMLAQSRAISGKVISAEDGSALPAVNVVLKGTTTGTVTDVDGNYRLEVPQNGGTLIFSFIGLLTQEVEIGDQSVIDVDMRDDVTELTEVVVVGYGTQIKRDLTGNIAKVSGKDIENVPLNSVETTLGGRTAGVFIQQGSGKPGQAVKVRIRGSSSVTASNQPLFVVDGVPITTQNTSITNNQPTNPLSDINFNDVESIEVLKDASAAAIYGSRAANGVVIITTKSGQSGKTRFNVDLSTGFSRPSNKRDWLNGPQYNELFDEAYANSRDIFGFEPAEIFGLPNLEALKDAAIPGWRDNNDTDWQDLAFQDATVSQISINASGGSEKTRFYMGGTFNDQEGILIGNDFQRISGRLNLDHSVNDRLNFGISMGLTRSENGRVSNDNAFATPLQLVALPPVQPQFDPDNGRLFTGTVYYNGLIQDRDAFGETVVFRNIGNVYGNLEIIPGLTFTSKFGLDLLDQTEDNFQGRETQDGAPAGQGEFRTNRIVNYTIDNYLTYTTTFDDDLNLEVVGGMSYQESDQDIGSIQARGFPSDEFKKIASAAETESFSSSGTTFSYLSYFTRANLKLNNRYLLTLSGRIDGSSRFGEDNRYGFFPAASAGWILTEEPFLATGGTLSFLKLRASYGLTGNSEIGNFDALGLFQGTSYAGVSGTRPISVASPDLQWETTAQLDIGIDFGLFNDRITGELDYYFKDTEDLLLDVQVPSTTGFGIVTQNIGKLENKGVEIVINSDNLVGEFKWNTNFNLAYNENEITDLDGQVITSGINRAEEGHPLGVFHLVKYAGVDPANGDALFEKGDGTGETTSDFSEAEEQFVGSPFPDWVGGITNTLSYGGLELSFLFQFVSGNKIFNDGASFQTAGFDFFDNQSADQLRRWQNPGDMTDVPQLRFLGGNGIDNSTRYLQDGDYIRLRTATLSYQLPSTLVERIFLDNARVYVTGTNLWTITDYTGWDPEVNFDGTNPSAQANNIRGGRDFYTAPQARTIIFGVKLGF